MREFDLLKHVYKANAELSDRVLILPGDDMAMILLGDQKLLAATDQVVDGRHFNLKKIPLELAGRKAVTRSLSDIAAMAAKPVATLAAVTLPPDFGEDNAKLLFDAMAETANTYNCPLIGGDIAFHSSSGHPLVCTTTVLAKPVSLDHTVVTRSGAKVGDAVYVTSTIGGAWNETGLGKHLTFEPRIVEAIKLLQTLGANLHAMIDLSDGLGRDTGHIAEDSEVRIEIDVNKIPLTDGCNWLKAISDGEDYELLFTASGDVPSTLNDLQVTQIGEVTAEWQGEDAINENDPATWSLVLIDGDTKTSGVQYGWEHHT